jgi:intein/homing endonuclease
MKNVINNYVVSEQLKDRFYKSRYSDAVGNIYFEELSKYDSFFKFIYENNIVPLPIKSITSKGIKSVYDLSIENHQYFLANGFIVHNCYGMSPVGLSKRLKISKKEAEVMINKYFNRYRGIKRYLDRAGQDAVRNRYSVTASGRRRYYNMPAFDHPDRKIIQGSIERQGMNAGIQGCLVADSVINGLGNIENLVGQRFNIHTGFGKDSATGVYSGKKEVYNLKLSNGSIIGITGEHTIPTINDGGDFKDKKSSELNGNDFLLLPLNVVGGEPTNLTGYTYTKGHWRETFVNFILPNSMSEDLAFIIGCLLGDGSYSKHNHVKFCCPEHQMELFEKFNVCVEKVFGYKPVIRKQTKNRKIPLYDSQICSVVIRGFLKHIGLDYVVNRDKKIPDYFYTETIINKGALLNGLFSTDGGMQYRSGANFTNTSKHITNGVHQLLFSIGINSNLKEYTNKYGKVYRLQVPKRFNDKFLKHVGFSVNVKQSKLINSGSIPKFGDDSIVPKFIPKLIENVLIKDPYYSKNFTVQEKAHLKMFKQGKCSYSSWRRFYKKMPECVEKKELSKYIDFDFCKVRNFVYRGIEDTYDIMCDNIHYFTSNGIILHNSNADTIKESMILLAQRLEGYDARLLLTVHDEVVVEAREDIVNEIAPIVSQSLIDGFGKYFSLIPMESSTLIGPCWLKGACEERLPSGKKCDNLEMKFVEDSKYGSKLVCNSCGAPQD